jgi:hypothetical protein
MVMLVTVTVRVVALLPFLWSYESTNAVFVSFSCRFGDEDSLKPSRGRAGAGLLEWNQPEERSGTVPMTKVWERASKFRSATRSASGNDNVVRPGPTTNPRSLKSNTNVK